MKDKAYIVAGPELVYPLGFRILRRKHDVVVGRSIVDMTALLLRHCNLLLLLPQASQTSTTKRPKHKNTIFLLARDVVSTASE